MENQILAVIIVTSVAVFVIATIYYYPEVFQKLLCRVGLGMASILGANHALAWLGIGLYVGINPLSVLVLLIMGGPGMLLLYGVEAYCKFFP